MVYKILFYSLIDMEKIQFSNNLLLWIADNKFVRNFAELWNGGYYEEVHVSIFADCSDILYIFKL